MTADKLCGGMNNDIRAVLNGSDKIGSAEGVVNNQRQAVLVSKLCKRVDIGNIAVGVSESFNINGSRIVFYRRFNLVKVVNINKRSGNSEAREGVGKQIVGAAVYVIAAAPEAVARAATPPSRAAILFSKTSWVELVSLP